MDRLHFARFGQITLLLVVAVSPAAAVASDSPSKSRGDRAIVVPTSRRFAPVALQVAPPPLPKSSLRGLHRSSSLLRILGAPTPVYAEPVGEARRETETQRPYFRVELALPPLDSIADTPESEPAAPPDVKLVPSDPPRDNRAGHVPEPGKLFVAPVEATSDDGDRRYGGATDVTEPPIIELTESTAADDRQVDKVRRNDTIIILPIKPIPTGHDPPATSTPTSGVQAGLPATSAPVGDVDVKAIDSAPVDDNQPDASLPRRTRLNGPVTQEAWPSVKGDESSRRADWWPDRRESSSGQRDRPHWHRPSDSSLRGPVNEQQDEHAPVRLPPLTGTGQRLRR